MNKPWSNRTALVLLAFIFLVAPGLAQSQGDTQGDSSADASQPVRVRAEFRMHTDEQTGTLAVTASLQKGYHVYAMTQPKPFIATRIEVEGADQFALTNNWEASRAAKLRRHQSLDVELHEYEGQITWTAPFTLASGVSATELQIRGTVYAQACTESHCLAPKTYPFTARLVASDPANVTKDIPVEPTNAAAPATSAPPARLDFSKLEAQGNMAAALPLMIVLPMAFAAGLILNFMPCVLPVIGLKIMSFAQQAGDSRRRIFLLNAWYTLGIASVFLVLATLAVISGLTWGEQFSSVTFTGVLASVVFVFALSFLGVWEIAIPGFVGSGKANELAQREGPVGAFNKGVLTTVLATPCSGPLLGSALTWAVTQPPVLTYVAFALVGLGMASPYLVVGAFPQLLGWLPKPGEWMNTFKQMMGFVLLATVVYLLTIVPAAYVVPTVTLLVGLGAACWWIGRTTVTASPGRKLATWAQASVLAAAAGLVAFGWLHGVMESRFQRAVERELVERQSGAAGGAIATDVASPAALTLTEHVPGSNELSWQVYSRERLERLTAEGKTVLVDFTADWCLTCKSNEAIALNMPQTKRFIESHGVATLKADKTRPAADVDELLKALGNKAGSIPFYAIFPAGNPNQPILLDGLFTSPAAILHALKRAGPSRDAAQQAKVAMPRHPAGR